MWRVFVQECKRGVIKMCMGILRLLDLRVESLWGDIGIGLLAFGVDEGGFELLVAADWVRVECGMVFLNIVEVLEELGLVDRKDVGQAFGVSFGRIRPDEKPAVFGFLQISGGIQHK